MKKLVLCVAAAIALLPCNMKAASVSGAFESIGKGTVAVTTEVAAVAQVAVAAEGTPDEFGNINCRDCVGCTNCRNCVGCRNCDNCRNCDYVRGVNDKTGLKGLQRFNIPN